MYCWHDTRQVVISDHTNCPILICEVNRVNMHPYFVRGLHTHVHSACFLSLISAPSLQFIKFGAHGLNNKRLRHQAYQHTASEVFTTVSTIFSCVSLSVITASFVSLSVFAATCFPFWNEPISYVPLYPASTSVLPSACVALSMEVHFVNS